jgi:hypothetical protein
MGKRYRSRNLFLFIVIVISLGLAVFPMATAAEWGVDTATAPVDDWLSLSAGESRWYAFQHAGDGSQVQVRLQVVPEGSAGFVVWTPELIERWGLGQRVEPIGRGSDDPFAEGVLTWSGSFTTDGTYYVVVEQASGQPGTSYYLLEIEGGGVSLPVSAPVDTSASAATTTSAPSSKSQPKSPLAAELEGKLVFQTAYGGPFYTINADGSNLQRITNGIDPVWSPDGEQIAFVRWEDPRGVWVVNTETGNEWRAFDWSETRYPSWSPDGGQIVFSRQNGGTGGRTRCFRGRCFTMPAKARWTLGIVNPGDGAFWEPLPNSDTNLTPDWSPDGDSVVFAGAHGLMVQSVDGTPSADGASSTDGAESWQLTEDPRDTNPVWSPDGTQVAFVRRQHDHWEIYVIDVTTGQQTRLTDTPDVNGVAANSVSPAWSPDGNYIAFLTDRTGAWEIWIMKANGSAQASLFGTELDGLTLDYAFAGERAIDWVW